MNDLWIVLKAALLGALRRRRQKGKSSMLRHIKASLLVALFLYTLFPFMISSKYNKYKIFKYVFYSNADGFLGHFMLIFEFYHGHFRSILGLSWYYFSQSFVQVFWNFWFFWPFLPIFYQYYLVLFKRFFCQIMFNFGPFLAHFRYHFLCKTFQ